MADIDLTSSLDNIGSGLATTGSQIGHTLYLVLTLLLLAVAIIAAVWFILWWSSFKHHITIREITGHDGHYLVTYDKAKRKRKNGAEFWKLRRRKALIPAPPSAAIQVTRRGRYYVECAHHEKSGLDSGYEWITPSKDPLKGDYVINQTQEERALLADRLRRANDRRSMRTLDFIMQFGGMFFVLVIVVSLLAFYGDIAKSVADSSKEVEGVLQRAQRIQEEQILFQQELNKIFSKMECSPPDQPIDLPLDQQIGG